MRDFCGLSRYPVFSKLVLYRGYESRACARKPVHLSPLEGAVQPPPYTTFARIEVKWIGPGIMMSYRVSSILKKVYKRPRWDCRLCSTVPQAPDDRDPAPLFFDQRVQELMTTLTRIDYRRVFAARRDGTPLDVPKFKFMTDEQLQAARSKIGSKARGRIQMPPVVRMRSDKVQVLSRDPAIQGYEKHDILFTDISFGCTNRDRLIVVRDTNGVLRHADPRERHRANQIYFPLNGREVHTPQMFFEPHLSELLEKEEFEFVLDRACLQFEPDDPEYHRVTRQAYAYVNKLSKFDALRSTRHFGPFVFYLTWENDIHRLLIDLLKSDNLEEAAALVRLYHKLHPDSRSAAEPIRGDAELVRVYAELDSPERHAVTRALQTCELMRQEKKEVAEGVMKAHGLKDDTDGEAKT